MERMQEFPDAQSAVDELCRLYIQSTELAKDVLATGETERYVDVVYPKLIVDVLEWRPIDRTEPFCYVDGAGRYSALLSRTDVMRNYLLQMLDRLVHNYPCRILVGPSDVQIPPAYIDDAAVAGQNSGDLPKPTLDDVDDAIIDGEWDAFHGEEMPLFQFSPQRFDIACKRIEHYTGIEIETVQDFILFTNYQMHTTEFVRFALRELTAEESRYTKLMLPNGQEVTREQAQSLELTQVSMESSYQMPRYDLCTDGDDGITMINIGVGPSNAKTITDSLAVLRPKCWVMIGHCAGLDARMRIGDLILGNAYQRRDHLLNEHIDIEIPIPAVPEVQRALENAVKEIYGGDKSIMRTGTVLSTGDRNWEWHTRRSLWETLRGSTAVAVDMESSALAANGYRYRVPYGTLLSVSDLPLHAVPKLPAAARAFYSSSKEAHMMCAVRAVEQLAAKPHKLRTRKLRKTIGEVPFR